MSVLGAEARKDHPLVVSLAITISIRQVQQLRTGPDIGPAVTDLDSGRNQQTIREHSRLVSHAISVGVFQHEDLVVGRGTRGDLRIDLAAGNPQTPLSVEVHVNRLGDQRITREEVNLKPLRKNERGAFEFRIGVRDFLQFTLSERGVRHEHEAQQRSGQRERISSHRITE